jgi:hypothetical protein
LAPLARVVDAVLGFAGMPRHCELVDARAPSSTLHPRGTDQPGIFFISGDAERLVFKVERVGAADLALGAVCHAVAQLAARGRADETRETLWRLSEGFARAVEETLAEVDGEDVRERLGLPTQRPKRSRSRRRTT